jgi:TRAP-type C4-dicarboxylate transport system permease small subunit
MNAERPSTVSRILGAVAMVEDALLIVLLTGMICLAAAQILLRNVFGTGLLWADPGLRLMVLWVGMLGAMVATRQDKQITVDALSRFLPERWKAAVRVVTDLFTSGVAGFVAWHAGRLVLDDRAAGSMVFAAVPVWVCELVLPVAFGVIALRYAAYAVRNARIAAGGSSVQ